MLTLATNARMTEMEMVFFGLFLGESMVLLS